LDFLRRKLRVYEARAAQSTASTQQLSELFGVRVALRKLELAHSLGKYEFSLFNQLRAAEDWAKYALAL
jgi:hypothetical protein